MSRIIDADALMKDICDSLNQMTNIGIAVDGDWLWAKLNDAIDNAQTIKSEQMWIPVSERLPELDEAVLATTAWNDITIAWRIGICKWFVHEGNTNAETDDIIAWMPLPLPYKGEQE